MLFPLTSLFWATSLIGFMLLFNIQSVMSIIFNNSGPIQLNNEKRLIDDLLKNYQVKFGRPVNNMSEKVVVYFGLYLIQLIDLDEKNQVLVTNVHSVYQWKDNALKWNISQYGDVFDIRLPVNRIWTPDIVLYNYADARLEEKREVLAIVKPDGTVTWRPPSIFKSTCQINIQKFPYDEQNCSMKFGSWTYNGDSIDIRFYEGLEEINRNQYTESNEWDIISAKGIRSEIKYECCIEIFPDITFFLKMKRKGGFYNYILVLPCVLLSCLTTILFWLPPESPAKMVLGMNIFTSFFVLLLLLSKNVPSASDNIPVIGAYYCLNMVMIATSTCSCTAVVHIFFRGQGHVPYIIRKIFLEFLARIFCMVTPPALPPAPVKKSRKIETHATIITSVNNTSNQSNGNLQHHVNKVPVYQTLSNQTQVNSQSCTALNGNEETNNYMNKPYPNDQIHKANYAGIGHCEILGYQTFINPQIYQTLPSQGPKYPTVQNHQQFHQNNSIQYNKNHLTNDLNLSFSLIENDIKEIRDYLRHTRKKLENTDAKSKQTNEWKQVALVLDRTLFYLYIIAIIVSFILMFPR
ncbi:neuronal acetylcholine receptor subunit alpha-10-like isoform X2 [Brachionus plicatilis]|uniref:Neuronal acetylcholine receptor subunit alpha-10-like isoform X2 n=1 Tax=Brachionus plicatilis TaxID=10195 RepID=A0A3M7PMI7_BRAPC|nr:neuronal acetylcholine receptor subunit alpha-10-like isoform X2 [Brachionus plicatilis]